MKPKHVTMVAFAFTGATLAAYAMEYYTRAPKLSDADRIKLQILCALKPDHPLCILLHTS